MCGSKNYPYLPHGRDFSLDPHHPSVNSSQASYITLKFWAFEKLPTPKEFSIPSVGGSMDIFWYYTIYAYCSFSIINGTQSKYNCCD